MKRFLLATSAAAALWALPAQSQTLTITEVDHVGNRITVEAPGIDKRVVDLDAAAISSGSQRIRIGDLQAGDQVVVDGTLSGTRLTARSVRLVPATPDVGTGDANVEGDTAPTDAPPRALDPAPRGSGTMQPGAAGSIQPGAAGSLQPGAPLPPPSPGGAGRP